MPDATAEPADVAFVGLGTMGFPMAGHLAVAGHRVRVHNRTAATAERWTTRFGGVAAATPAAAAHGARFVFVCVGGDPDVEAVVLGDQGVLAAMAPGSVLVDHSTVSADLARRLHLKAGERGVGFLDAPVSGGQSGAENAVLAVMAGGDDDVFARAAPVMACYARTCVHTGAAGAGQLTKMVNQILCAAAIQGAAEALTFALKAGLDPDTVLSVVTQGAANSWYLANRGHTMVRDEFDFGFAVDWMAKDLRICAAEAARLGVPLPSVALMAGELAELQRRGANRLDATSVIRVLRDQAGIPPD